MPAVNEHFNGGCSDEQLDLEQEHHTIEDDASVASSTSSSSSSTACLLIGSCRDRSHPTIYRSSSFILRITYVNVFIFALCYQMQQPIEPFLVAALTREDEQIDEDSEDSIARTYSWLQAFSFAMHTFGCPFVGWALDRWGIRKASSLVYLSAALAYALLSGSNNMTLLFCSKIPTAVAAGFLVAQATATAMTNHDEVEDGVSVDHGTTNKSGIQHIPNNTNSTTRNDNGDGIRAQALGRMTAAYTLGAAVGPALGGFLVEHLDDLYVGARVAVLGSIVSVVLSVMYLPDDTAVHCPVYRQHVGNGAAQESDHLSQPNHEIDSNDHVELAGQDPQCKSTAESPNCQLDETEATFRPDEGSASLRSVGFTLLPLFFCKVMGGVSSSMHSTVLPIVLTQQLEFDPATLGISMSSSMLAVALFGVLGMKPLANAIGANGMAQLGASLRAVLVVLMAWIVARLSHQVDEEEGKKGFLSDHFVSSAEAQIIAACILVQVATHALATGLTTQTTGAVLPEEQGTLLGIEHSLFGFARILGPPAGTALFVSFNESIWPVALGCAAIDAGLGGLFFILRKGKRHQYSSAVTNPS